VIVDQVYTYTSNRHPWFQESRRSADGPKSDWYVWADARPDGSPPNNWLSIFGGPAWEWDRSRRQYYMTHFLPGMPHLRVQQPEVQEALLDIGRFWLERGVDGFRLDVINLAMVDEQLRDNPITGVASFALPAGAQQAIYDRDRPENLEFVRRIRRLADERPERFLMGEISGPPEVLKAYTTGPGGLHSAYWVLGLVDAGIGATTLRRELENWTAADASWPTYSFSNHDVVRGLTRCGGPAATPALARLLNALLLTVRGTALLYQGDELGLPDGDVPYDRLRDPASRRFYPDHLQRDGARTPMPWSASVPHAGFTTGQPWLPSGRRHATLAVDTQERDATSTLAITRQLVALRRRESALRTGDIRFLDQPETVLAFDRIDGARRLRCVYNVSSSPTRIDLPGMARATPLMSSGMTAAGGRIELVGHGFGILAMPST
jgi:alpha-glucosidase